MGIHGLLLGMECGGLKRFSFEKPRHRPISISLAIRQPQIPAKKVEDKPSTVSEKRSFDIPASPKKKITPRAPKPVQQNRRKSSTQPVEKKLPTFIPKTASESPQGFKPMEMKHTPQAPTTEDIRMPANQTMVEARPLYRVNPPPKYPAMARKRGYTGQVVLDVLVGQNGNVVDLRLFSSSRYDVLDKAAIASVKTWTFDPGMRGDEKVEMWVRVPIRFELK